MSNANKRRGTEWETAVCRYLNTELGMYAEPVGEHRFRDPTAPDNVRRQPQDGLGDVGDVWARPFVLECKNVARVDLPAFVRQAEREAERAGLPFGVAVIKSRGRPAAEAHVVMSLRTLARLIRHVRGLRDAAERATRVVRAWGKTL